MGRRGFHGRPEAPSPKAPPVVAESAPSPPAAVVEAPAAVLPVVSPDALTEANARIDALTVERYALAARVDELTAECASLAEALAAASIDRASLASNVNVLAAEVERLRAALKSAEGVALAAMGDEPAARVRVPYVRSGIRYNGRDYEPGDRFPFDPLNPPAGVVCDLVEGEHYVYRDA